MLTAIRGTSIVMPGKSGADHPEHEKRGHAGQTEQVIAADRPSQEGLFGGRPGPRAQRHGVRDGAQQRQQDGAAGGHDHTDAASFSSSSRPVASRYSRTQRSITADVFSTLVN